jgi:hypothetical protein
MVLRLMLVPAVAATLLLSGAVQAKKGEWQQVPLSGAIPVELADGSERVLEPSCSGGIVMEGTVPRPGNTDYSFFILEGNPDKILISLDGGGACWDAASCLLSPLAPQLFGGRPTYSPEVNETVNTISQVGGILDSKNVDNPFSKYTKIFVPYCTGDIHWGSKDTDYSIPLPDGQLLQGTIRHRGADNLLAVLDWLEQNGIDFEGASDVTVAGASAGGYGANLAFAYVAEKAGSDTRLNLISDSAVGIIDTPEAIDKPGPLPFYAQAIYNSENPGTESWGVARNLPSWVFGPHPDAFLELSAEKPVSLVPAFFSALQAYAPDANLASITTNADLVQIGFYGLMKGGSAGLGEIFEWYGQTVGLTQYMAALPNYRSFIEDGACHTFIFTDAEFYHVGANGISVADWVAEMILPTNRFWDSTPAWPLKLPPDDTGCSALQ